MAALRAVLFVTAVFLCGVNGQFSVTIPCPSLGIRLERNSVCYPNGSYFGDGEVNENTNTKRLSCILPGRTGNGQWVRVADPLDPVTCGSNSDDDPFQCSSTNDPATVNLWLAQGLPEAQEGFYKCCLPTDCSSATNTITVNIFKFAQIASFYVDLPTDMTVYPQEYTLHCVKIGFPTYIFELNLGSTSLINETGCTNTLSSCSGDRVLLQESSNIIRNSFNFSWDGMTISNESYSQSFTGDQHYQCIVRVPDQTPRIRNVTIQVPSSAPTGISVSKTAKTITVNWTALDSSDADGYVVNVTSDIDTVRTVQVEGSSNNTITLNGLTIGTTYNITVRAYQQLLGPASSTISVSIHCEDQGIYLTHRGDCISNGSYFHDNSINGVSNSIVCLLPNSTLNGGEWVAPSGSPVDCSSTNPILCNDMSSPANISLYKDKNKATSASDDGWYKCCLPTSCSDPNTNMITVNIYRWGQIEDITVDLPSDITVLPQTYTLHAIKIGEGSINAANWYYESGSTSTELCSGNGLSYDCSIGSGVYIDKDNGRRRDYTLTITWNEENMTSGILSQSNSNGDHVYRFYLHIGGAMRNRSHTITVPATAPSSLTMVNKTATTITVNWTTLDSSDADGYVVNVTSDTDTVQTVQVEGSSNNTITLNGLRGGTTYNVTVRAYQQLLGPASSTISVQTLPVINSINWTLVSFITQLNNTQYRIDCLTTTDINPSTDVYWLVNGVMKGNSMYTSIDVLTYNNTLLVYPDPLGVSVNVTCIAMNGGVNYNQSVILHAPNGLPNNVRGFILSATNIKVNWTTSPETNGYVIEYTTGGVFRNVVSTSENQIVLTDLSQMSSYTISVYSYIDLPSVNSAVTVLRFDVPSPVTSLSVSNVSTTDITVNWTIPSSEDGNYVTYYIISYTPSCPELSSVNDTVSVAPHQSITTYSYTSRGLYSGMNYTITVRASNVLGGSDSTLMMNTIATAPSGAPVSVSLTTVNSTANNLTWNEVNCSQRNGLIIGYTVMISNSSITYNLNSTERYIILNDLVFGTVYNISVAGVNSVGRGPFSDPMAIEIGIVPGPVGSLSSIMKATSAVILWDEPSYRPRLYPITRYEIGYHVLQSDNNCSMADANDINLQALTYSNSSSDSSSTTLNKLNANTCYIFVVRAHSRRGAGEWRVIANMTLQLPPQPSTTSSPGSTTPGSSGSFATVGAAAGGAVGAIFIILLIIVIVLVIFLVLRRKGNNKEKAYISGESSGQKANKNDYPLLSQKFPISEPEYEAMKGPENTTDTGDMYSTVVGTTQDPLYANVEKGKTNGRTAAAPAFDPLIPKTCPVSISDLGTHVASYHSESNTQFNQQYQDLYTGEDLPCTFGFSDQNKPFNRFKNIAPYDENMILLQQKPNLEKCQREYINATYVDGYSSAKKFIAAQGPMKKTLVDFWRLIWQERPVCIVMVTNLKEGTKSKCEQYWPDGRAESEEYGPFTVTLVDEQVLPDFVIRSITVMIQDGSNDSHTLTQYHLTSWPDHGVPDYATPLMILHRQSTKSWSPSKGPILVHCSAGVGRTGTFIAVDIALEQAKKEGVVDIAGIVNRLRQQRMKMVQTLDQYVFLHDAVLEAIICGETEMATENFTSNIQKLKRINPKTRCTIMESQFGLLHQVTPDPDDVHCNSAKAHADKNRSKRYPPPDKFIVALKEANGYINASYLNGYREKRAFIIAQSPMENTVRDFWKMIVDYKVSAIVMLCGEEDCCYPYWPNLSKYGEYIVEVINEKNRDGYIERLLKVSSDKENKSVLQLQVTDWPQDGVVREPRTVLQVIDDVIHRQQKIGGGPVVVHCSDTVSRSGVYCSVSIALEQCKAEGVVDVFQVTKAVRRSKPGAVTTLEQYTSIYDVIDMYLQMNSMYGNFTATKQ